MKHGARVVRSALIICLSAAAAGCFNMSSLIKLNPDGSGTLEQTLLLNRETFKRVAEALGSGQPPDLASLSAADWQRQATLLGGGARLASVDPAHGAAGFDGVKVVFAFDDVTKLNLAADLSLPGPMGGGPNPSSSTSSLQIGFTRAADSANGATLTIKMDDPVQTSGATPEADASGGPVANPLLLAMFKEMLKGASLTVAVEVAGRIVKTNADYVSGSKVTLIELDLEALLAQEQEVTRIQSGLKPGTRFSEIRHLFKGINGIKVNEPMLTIEFK